MGLKVTETKRGKIGFVCSRPGAMSPAQIYQVKLKSMCVLFSGASGETMAELAVPRGNFIRCIFLKLSPLGANNYVIILAVVKIFALFGFPSRRRWGSLASVRTSGPEHISLSLTWLFSTFNNPSQKVDRRKTAASSKTRTFLELLIFRYIF